MTGKSLVRFSATYTISGDLIRWIVLPIITTLNYPDFILDFRTLIVHKSIFFIGQTLKIVLLYLPFILSGERFSTCLSRVFGLLFLEYQYNLLLNTKYLQEKAPQSMEETKILYWGQKSFVGIYWRRDLTSPVSDLHCSTVACLMERLQFQVHWSMKGTYGSGMESFLFMFKLCIVVC